MPQDLRLVSIRQRRWRIVNTRSYDDCRAVTVAPAGDASLSGTRTFLTPFDVLEPVGGERTLRRVGNTRWRHACRTLFGSTAPPGGLRSVRTANIDILPHQLEPALAIVRGLGSRVLLADEVGLGKTIQAGIIAAELLARGAIDRVLVLTPSGLRDQWAAELTGRFSLPAAVVDAATQRRASSALPLGVNPWVATRFALVSVDYAKRPDILPPLAACRWDLVIIDEAHGAAGETDRRSAVHAIASHAAYVLLLTATPHSGDERSFAALCALGSTGEDQLLIFRRRRSDTRPAAVRRIHPLVVRPSRAERRMHTLLARYTSAVCSERPDAWLSASVLHKRALSSPWSLAQSLQRRIDSLEPNDGDGTKSHGEQLAFSWDPDGERSGDDEAPAWPAGVGLTSVDRERPLLMALTEAARSAASADSKVAALRRLLRRTTEPAIVFTEYRDTLLHVRTQLPFACTVLHGGLDRHERAAALADFGHRRCRVLLATDAGGEGLNLQSACRLVINLELPWNPVRLEQRIGRVDRIGQQRTVHAVHLIAGRTGETRILARLRKRVAAAQAAIGASDPIGIEEERAAAKIMVRARHDDGLAGAAPAFTSGSIVSLADDGVSEATRLVACRQVARCRGGGILADLEDHGAWVAAASRKTTAHLRNRLLLIWRVALLDADERIVESTIVALTAAVSHHGPSPTRHALDRLLRAAGNDLTQVVLAAAAAWRVDAERLSAQFAATRLARERTMPAAPAAAPIFQPGLFDRRAERQRVAIAAARAIDGADRQARLAAVERTSKNLRCSASLLLALAPRC